MTTDGVQSTPGAPRGVPVAGGKGGAVEVRRGVGERGAGRAVPLLVATAIAVVAIDAVTKVVVVDRLSGRAPVRLLAGAVRLTETRNSGAAFGVGAGATVLFSLVAVAVVVAILRSARHLRSRSWALTLGLLLGGALGNLGDRVLRSPGPLRGHVVDWIQLPHWPVFNLADSAIVVGGVCAVILASRGVRMDGRAPTPVDG